ncbi:hypothetical protein [Vibrio proteolyticus]
MNITNTHLEVHLFNSKPVRRDNKRRSYALNEDGQPLRITNTDIEKVNSIHNIIDWLDVEDSRRYAKGKRKTFCNIYAYDYCFLCKVYIPRVWWKKSALKRVRNGEKVKPEYGVTVEEKTANAIFDWFEKYGSIFGWYSTYDLTELQNSANQGKVCLIIAKRKTKGLSGHIVAVVPENDVFQAKRYSGEVVQPVESQAGHVNREYITKRHQWWKKSKFSGFRFWVHA